MKVAVIDERGHLHLYDPEQVEALAAVGLMWRQDDAWYMDSTRVDLGAWPELAICDFCSERPVTWEIDAEDFTLTLDQQPNYRSTAGWVACETCGGCVAAGARRGLEARVIAFCRARIEPTGYPLAPFLTAQRAFLAQFWRHYRGVRRYATPYHGS